MRCSMGVLKSPTSNELEVLDHARAVARKKGNADVENVGEGEEEGSKSVKREDKDDRAKRTVADIFGDLPNMV